MRIGVVTTSYPRTPDDPAGHFVGSHVHALRALGHDVEIIAGGGPSHDRDIIRIGGDLWQHGGAPDWIERHPLRATVAAARFVPRLVVEIARRARRWDAIVAHWLAPSALAALPARRPMLAIAHGGDVHLLRRLGVLGAALHALAARGAQLVFVAEALRTIARQAAPRLARYLAGATIQPMGLDVARFDALEWVPTMPPTLVIAARLVPIKGVDVAIEALARVREDVQLVIAGDGPARADLERLRDRLFAPRFAATRVTFAGAVDTRERDRLLARASAVLVPSRPVAGGRTEGTPMIALEALAAGVPVIASAVGGLRELPAVTHVAPERPDLLARAIDEVLASKIDRRSLQEAVAGLDWQAIASRLVPRSTGQVRTS